MLNRNLKKAVLAVVFLLAGHSLATATVKWGSLQVSPALEIYSVQDSNIYLDASGSKASRVNSLRPSIHFSLPSKGNEVRFGYSADIMSYAENPSKNDASNQAADAMLRLVFPTGFSCILSYDYLDTNDPLSAENVARVKRKQNNFFMGYSYKFSKNFLLGFNYSNILHKYAAAEYSASLDRRDIEATLEAAVYVSPKTALFLGYGMGSIGYIDALNENSSKSTQLSVGLRGSLTPKAIGELKVGTRNKVFDEITGKDVATSVVSLSSIVDFSKRTKLNISGARNIVESTFVNNLNYIENAFSMKLSQQIYSRWSASIGGAVSAQNYPEEATIGADTLKRQDANTQASLDVSYEALKYLAFGCNYTAKSRNSNFNSYDYNDTVVGLYTKLSF